MEPPAGKAKLSSDFKTIRRKFTQSVLKWSTEEATFEEEKPISLPDVSDLVNILRSVGFKLRQFEKCENKDYTSASTSSLNTAKCRVEITCGHSGLRAILESVVGECRCPTVESATQAEFWHVSGTTPSAKGSQESLSTTDEAGSSLVPNLPPAMGMVVKDIMSRILALTCDPKNVELNLSSQSLQGTLPHHSSLDTLNVPEYKSRYSNSSAELLDVPEPRTRSFSRTVSNIELPTCPLSPVSLSRSSAVTPRNRSSIGSSITCDQQSSLTDLSTSMERMSLAERSTIFCRLEVAKRSIVDVMSLLKVQPLAANPSKRKLGMENTSTPTARTRKPTSVLHSAISRSAKKVSDSPKATKRLPAVQSVVRNSLDTPGSMKKMTSKSAVKKTPGIPVPTPAVPRSSSTTKKRVKSDVSSGSSSSTSSSASKTRILKSVVRTVTRLSGGSDTPHSSHR